MVCPGRRPGRSACFGYQSQPGQGGVPPQQGPGCRGPAAGSRLHKKTVMKSPVLILSALLLWTATPGAEMRVGIIGCDTSHVPEFTEILNNPQAKGHVPGAKVVAAFPGGSKDIPSSWSRVEGYAKTLQEKYGVRIYDNIEEVCRDVDAVLLESLDGRP